MWNDDLVYQSRPDGRVKQISLSRAEYLMNNEKPIFVYENYEYKRIPSLDYYYRKNKSVYCELTDLYCY